MAPYRRKKVLCLGVSYANIQNMPSQSDSDLDEMPSETNDDAITRVIECVQRGLLTQMDGRDLARIVETERVCKVDVYSVSQEQGAVYRDDRHYIGDFNHRKFAQALQAQFPDVQFDQVILDYFWIPSGWDRQHWSRSFFQNTLVSLADSNMLNLNAKVYLPFCLHCLKEVLISQDVLLKHFNISFLSKNNLKEVALWKGTQEIDKRVMQFVLGKRKDQEEVYCSFGPGTVAADEADSSITKEEVVRFCRQLENFANVRFIKLQALPRPSHSKATRANEQLTMRKGNIQGLTQPSLVTNGFDHVASMFVPPPAEKLKRNSYEASDSDEEKGDSVNAENPLTVNAFCDEKGRKEKKVAKTSRGSDVSSAVLQDSHPMVSQDSPPLSATNNQESKPI